MAEYFILVRTGQGFESFSNPSSSKRLQMDGTELLVLQACNRVVADEYGFVFDDDLARHTQIPVSDVRSYLELLEKNDLFRSSG